MKKQPFHFLVLLIILITGVFMFHFVRHNTSLQLLVGIITSISYIIWGLVHHAIKRDLHRKVVVEYILIGAIAIIVLFAVVRG